jgi:hypothetical protein
MKSLGSEALNFSLGGQKGVPLSGGHLIVWEVYEWRRE